MKLSIDTQHIRTHIRRFRFQWQLILQQVKRNLFIYILIVLVITALGVFGSAYFWKPSKEWMNQLDLVKSSVPQDVSYRRIAPELDVQNLVMIGEVYRVGISGDRIRGMLLRALRFQNITRKVERKYNIPENMLLAMIMQESMGIDLLPNSTDDGGIGLCHMQPSTAKEFGLRTFEDCNDLRNFDHGRKLRELIRTEKYDKRKLIAYDDRFHPLLNIDAAGRMVYYFMNGPQLKNTPMKTAIYRYAGYKNYSSYYKMVSYYMGLLDDLAVIDDVRQTFNKLNPTLTINGQAADFDRYISMHQALNRNYGLDNYE